MVQSRASLTIADSAALQEEAQGLFCEFIADPKSLGRIELSKLAANNLEYFLFLNLREFPEIYVHQLFLSLGRYWSSRGSDIWVRVVELLDDNDVAAVTLVSFLGTWLSFDITPNLYLSNHVSSRVKNYVKDYFREQVVRRFRV